MFPLAILALASVASSANALVIPRSSIPATYAVGYLEDYHVYHTRYLALNCESQHNTTFFDDCCHPMLTTENLKDDRKAYCTPSVSASSSAAQAEPTSTDVPSGDDDCDDDGASSAADPTSTPVAPPKNVAADPATDDPTPSSSEEPKPSSSEKPKPAPSPSPAPAPKPSASSGGITGALSGIVGKVFSGGIATFFFQNGVAGNCGKVHPDSAFIVALPTNTYANGAHCGKKVIIKDTSTGHTETATVADSCPTCDNDSCLDLSKSLFEAFANTNDGTFQIQWGFAS